MHMHARRYAVTLDECCTRTTEQMTYLEIKDNEVTSTGRPQIKKAIQFQCEGGQCGHLQFI